MWYSSLKKQELINESPLIEALQGIHLNYFAKGHL